MCVASSPFYANVSVIFRSLALMILFFSFHVTGFFRWLHTLCFHDYFLLICCYATPNMPVGRGFVLTIAHTFSFPFSYCLIVIRTSII